MNKPESIGSIIERALITKLKQLAKERSMRLTDDEVLAQEHHVEMIRRPHLWPTGPTMLPLKKPKEGDLPDIALLHPRDGGYLVRENMSMMGVPFGEVIDHTFEDAEDVVMAGWEVD